MCKVRETGKGQFIIGWDQSRTLVQYQSLKPHFRLAVPPHWQTQKNYQISSDFIDWLLISHVGLHGYYTTLSYDVIHDVFVLFTPT